MQNTLEVARRTRAALVHISTCFVAGNRDGELIAKELLDLFPYQEHPRNVALTLRATY